MRIRSGALALALGAMLLAACESATEPEPAEALADLLADAETRSAAAGRGGAPSFDELARQISSFGGYYWDRRCNLNVVLVDLSQAGLAAELLGPFHARRIDGVDRCPDDAAVVAVQGQYTWAELLRYGTAARGVLRIRGVAGVSIDVRLNRLAVLVASRDVARRAARLLSDAGVPLDAVVFRPHHTSTRDGRSR